jgi:hypothetical protein
MPDDRLDEHLNELMEGAGRHYRSPPAPRLDLMWERIEARAFPAGRGAVPFRPRRARLFVLAFAATLLLGVALGFSAARLGGPGTGEARLVEPRQPGIPSAYVAFPSPFVGVASDYLQQTTAFLITLARGLRDGEIPREAVGQARHLLSTTRLLLDAGVADPALEDLLGDLELVLAQVARAPAGAQESDAALITEALDQRGVLSRLTLLLADASYFP